jgi:hypothetical protein
MHHLVCSASPCSLISWSLLQGSGYSQPEHTKKLTQRWRRCVAAQLRDPYPAPQSPPQLSDRAAPAHAHGCIPCNSSHMPDARTGMYSVQTTLSTGGCWHVRRSARCRLGVTCCGSQRPGRLCDLTFESTDLISIKSSVQLQEQRYWLVQC